MSPSPEEQQPLLQSVRLVKNASIMNVSSSRTPSPSSPLPPSYLPLLQVTPYCKGPPEWESPDKEYKVTDIVAHFEHLNKKKDAYLDVDGGSIATNSRSGSRSSQNESRSSGIFSDFEEDHDQSWVNPQQSSTPLRNNSGNNNDNVTPMTTPTPIPYPRTLSFAKVFGEKDGEIEVEDQDLPDQEDEDEQDQDAHMIRSEPEVEVNYILEEIINDDHDHTQQDENISTTKTSLITKLFSFSIFLYLFCTGILGAVLLGLSTTPRFLDYLKLQQIASHQEVLAQMGNSLHNLQRFLALSPNSLREGLPLLMVAGITIQFLGWYFTFRRHFWNSKTCKSAQESRLSRFLANLLLVLFQPGLFLVSRSETMDEDDNSGQNEYNFQLEDSGFLEEDDASQIKEPLPFSFDSALVEDDSEPDPIANSTPRRHPYQKLLITAWLSLVQILSVCVASFTLSSPNYLAWEKFALVESFLIFGQFPQLVIVSLLWPLLTFISSRRGNNKRKIS